MDEAALSARLWRANLPLADSCLAHPFVRGLGDGTLDAGLFKGYVAQDAFFLRSFLAAYSLTAAKCARRPRAVKVLHELIGGVLEELELHAGYAASLGIDLEAASPTQATSAYTDFLERVAWTGEPGEIVAAMTPCMRLYAFLGQSLLPADPEKLAGNPYREWIETYAGDEFEALAASLEQLLDELGEESATIRDAYGYAMRCELDFFESAFRPPGS